ncbi:HPr family phosphocarrier protein, partial [Saccharomonospora saliphila]|uniref:HPr family phosphocarrier protein n=1 Tax=Saccharomonospora saliphila TaxID=369829 RepID=UPI0003617241
MAQRTVTVGSSVGLHARPAALFTQAAARQQVGVLIGKPGGEPVDARSILSVIGLGARGGDEVVLHADGPGA